MTTSKQEEATAAAGAAAAASTDGTLSLPPSESATNGTSIAPVEEKEADHLATIGEVYSFADSWTIKLQIIVGFFFAVVSGSVYPGML